MSEPMSSGEIEDVLSSIRRLVSEDLRPVSKGTGAAKPAIPEAGKLLLTPALRVVSTQEAAPKAAPAAPKAEKPLEAVEESLIEETLELSAPDLSADDRDARASLAPGAASNAAPKTAPKTAPGAASRVRADAPADEDWLPESNEDEAAFPGWAAAPQGGAKAGAAEAPSDITRVVSEIAAGVADAEDDWEPETGDSPVASMAWQAPEWVEEAELVEESQAAKKALSDQAEAAAVAEIAARAAQAEAEAQAKAKAEATKPAASDSAPEEDIFAEDEGYFDETVLRDLVRDLIREELSGTLGERITRNVRKLVRAEINRALTARDFD